MALLYAAGLMHRLCAIDHSSHMFLLLAKVARMLAESGPVAAGTGVTKQLNAREKAEVIANANASVGVVMK